MKNPVITPTREVRIFCAASCVGHDEKKGPLGDCFDLHDDKDTFGQKTWEGSESEMQRLALNAALAKAKLKSEDIDLLLAGDLLNQCIGSSFGLLSFQIPYLGLYGACSTAAESILLASLLCGGGYVKRAAAVTSSHNCSAERQFRYPIEYGGQRTPTSQWTVTGSGAFLLENAASGGSGSVQVAQVMPGRAIDKGITDANNMGAAMAPAALDTLDRYFRATGTAPSDFDLILTGDLGREGSKILRDLCAAAGFPIDSVHSDCGLLIYPPDSAGADKHAGGSGCGCSAVVLASHILPQLEKGILRDILFIGTGALMNPMSIQQGNSIPSIAHLVRLTSVQDIN